jgi:hypothetical protein
MAAMVDFDRIAEQKIQEALERGDFDGLPLAGQRLELDDDGNVPEDLRLSYRLLKNAGLVPEELALRSQVATLQGLLEAATDDEETRRLRRELVSAQLRYDLFLERQGGRGEPVEYRAALLRRLAGG